MERGSAKHGPRLDDDQKREEWSALHRSEDTSPEEWQDPEALDAPGDKDLFPREWPSGREPVTPEGMTPGEVDSRSVLASWISGTHAFPADRATLLARAEEEYAPDSVLSALQSLPDRTFANVEDVADALGLGGRRG